ncbi:NADP-dependent oxidoreductase [Dactylosporangium aurantiacum]|uniref:NADP-dependent oxidoreductase n=1 Tax=Dactylosporangium aurantiacum TaxID=35754 RepID=A0A9Q9MKF7_9ACTN|nr:NADP-dependent oxidoreductase [Dactylosporangium aurantiacum]MDG6102968.1 NADP-dependent oxidoreductase [Dactylosporangium aurantiacum]UWZ52812.1 NADP-dependent oxidoreductase [Dactylosporangium aurantiacum]
MKALQYSEYGPSSVLHVVDVDEPQPGPGQVRVRVRAVGINPFDWKVRSGAFGDTTPTRLPVIPHGDVSGVVDAVGPAAAGAGEGVAPKVGEEVFGVAAGGGAAEFAVLKFWVAKPAGMSFEEAAGLPGVVEAAGRSLTLLGLDKGQTIVVNGAAGGVGIAATQLAVARGATVIGTASERNHEFLRSLGAVPVTYGEGLVDRVRAVAPQGVDLALDTAGRGAVADLITLTGVPANVVSLVDFDAPKLGARVTDGSEGRAWDTLREAADLYHQGRFTMPVERVFPFADAAAAHDLSQSGHVRGKVILVP